MSADEEKVDISSASSRAEGLPPKIGIIAGGGDLPQRLMNACDEQGVDVFVVALEGHAAPDVVEGRYHLWSRLGAVGTILKALREHEVRDLVLIGSVRRPSISEIMPDMKAMAFFSKAGIKALSGDDSLLVALRGFLEEEGFNIHGVHKFAKDLLMPHGVLGKVQPSKDIWRDINRGVEVSQILGKLDVGQAVVVQQGLVLGVEAIEGTDQLLSRCTALRRKGAGGVLVKTCKPQQDRDLDMPTIGLTTLEAAHRCGLAGIAVHAGNSLVVGLDEIVAFANKNKMFVVGVEA